MSEIPTVYVRHPNDAAVKMRINLSDYDPAKHTLWRDNDAVQEKEQGQEVAPAPKKRGRPRRG